MLGRALAGAAIYDIVIPCGLCWLSWRRFILRYNIERFERALARETDPVQQKVIAKLLDEARRELAMLQSERAEPS